MELQQTITTAGNKVLEIIYRRKLEDFTNRLSELKNPTIVYVSELVSCSHKHVLRTVFPELQFKLEPASILGELVHGGLESILAENGYKIEISIEKEVVIEDAKYIIKGRMDAYNEEEGVVVEIKTARSSQGIPHPHHIMQLQIYMNIVKASRGLLIYITPDRLVEFNVARQEIEIDELLKQTIKDLVHPRWSWECRYCPYAKLCPYRVSEEKH